MTKLKTPLSRKTINDGMIVNDSPAKRLEVLARALDRIQTYLEHANRPKSKYEFLITVYSQKGRHRHHETIEDLRLISSGIFNIHEAITYGVDKTVDESILRIAQFAQSEVEKIKKVIEEAIKEEGEKLFASFEAKD